MVLEEFVMQAAPPRTFTLLQGLESGRYARILRKREATSCTRCVQMFCMVSDSDETRVQDALHALHLCTRHDSQLDTMHWMDSSSGGPRGKEP